MVPVYYTPSGALGVVGIDQQDKTLRVRTREMLECEDFVVVRLRKGVRHRTVDWNTECDRSGYRRCPVEAGDITRPRGEYPASAP